MLTPSVSAPATAITLSDAHAHHGAVHTHAAATKRYVLGVFDDPDVLLDAIEHVRAAGIKIHDVYTPFPIHGIDDVLGIARTRLPIAAFMFGCCGLSLALFLQVYMLWADWPMIIGGKPQYAFPAFVPVCFELTVLCTAFGMVITFFLVSGLRPKFKVQVMDRRSTDDKFVIAIEQTASSNQRQVTDLLRQHGASEVNEKEIAVKH
ncbi:MAG: DUF3341 domain-containing protein [Hymenobacteraceae bacterium]|nr:DUF3341 domain-containing protein [Hymenobacteraceae bacterium]